MVLSFFRGGAGDGDFDQIVSRSVAMIGEARHSFDLATLALLTEAGPGAIADDVRDTDQRINTAEQELRRELVVHVAVKGTADIGSVMGFTLLLKKIERVGDQAKNILELAENGVNLAAVPETETLLAERRVLSALFTEAGELLGSIDPDAESVEDYGNRVEAIMSAYQTKIDQYMTSERPGNEVVPLAIYYRFLRRIAANLLGAVRTSAEPAPFIDYLEDGSVDTDD